MGFLRFIFAISVVIAHSGSLFGFSFVGGEIAVQTFYIISGFYMSLILNEKYIGSNGSYKLFIENRFLRLFPIYWIVLILTFIVLFSQSFLFPNSDYSESTLAYYRNYSDILDIFSFVYLILVNIFVFFQDTILFLGLDISSGNLFFTSDFRQTMPMLYKFLFVPQAWTIGLELMFYVIAPFLVRRRLKTLLIFISISVLIRITLVINGYYKDPWSYRFFPSELVFFLLGILSYHFYRFWKKKNIEKKYFLFVYFIIIAYVLFFNFIPKTLTKFYLFQIAFFVSLPFIFILTKNWKFDRYVGELSYPIYISHINVVKLRNSFKIMKIS